MLDITAIDYIRCYALLKLWEIEAKNFLNGYEALIN
mgnify:CR=1 FL=1